jgi:hypothetical protein
MTKFVILDCASDITDGLGPALIDPITNDHVIRIGEEIFVTVLGNGSGPPIDEEHNREIQDANGRWQR